MIIILLQLYHKNAVCSMKIEHLIINNVRHELKSTWNAKSSWSKCTIRKTVNQ